MPKEMMIDKSEEDVGLERKIAGALIAIWGLLGLSIISYEITVLLNGFESYTLARFTLNTGIVFGGLGILFNLKMGYTVALFLISLKIAIDIASSSFIQLAVDVILFLGIVTAYISKD
ncbi:MAG: hypothetical protein R6V35_05065 [Candidatus Nanohaloarchaea archaeon]